MIQIRQRIGNINMEKDRAGQLDGEKELVSTGQEKVFDSGQQELIEKLSGGNKKYARFILAALGSIPWVGGVLSASAGLRSEQDQGKVNELLKLWLEEHKEKISELGKTLVEILSRLDKLGEEIQERIESPHYLALVRKTFRSWDQADTQEKRKMLSKLLANAGAITMCPDDLVRLFINWIDQYHEAHFIVIKEIYQNPKITRGRIWDSMRGDRPQENSAEADLFRYLIRDLSTGGVIRQERETNAYGEFMKKDMKGMRREKGLSGRVMESAFEDTKPYVLTELGKQFVHYVMEDVVAQISDKSNNSTF